MTWNYIKYSKCGYYFFSERADPNFSENYKGRLKEGANINRSLVTLGNVIKALGKSAIL